MAMSYMRGQATKTVTVSKYPSTLFESAKRFQRQLAPPHNFCKIPGTIDFPAEWVLDGQVDHLRAVLEHRGGSMANGHYVAYVRALDGSNTWRLQDDGTSSDVPFSQVSAADGYVFLYTRRHAGLRPGCNTTATHVLTSDPSNTKVPCLVTAALHPVDASLSSRTM